MASKNYPSLTEDELAALLDGTADETLRRRLEENPEDQARLLEAQKFEKRLLRQLYRGDCPSAQLLGEYQAGLLDEEQAKRIVKHLKICVRCADELAELESFMTSDEQQPSLRVLPRLYELKSPKIIRLQIQQSSLRAVRGAGRAPIVAQAEGISLFVETQEGRDGRTLMGQLVADDADEWEGALLEARYNDAIQGLASFDSLGSFQLRLESDVSVIALRVISRSGRVIVLDAISLTVS